MKPVLTVIILSMLAITKVYAASPVVLELFTSQGCSSCPPADALLQKLSADPSLLALSFHIDYWDQLGWRDPFSLVASTQRQKMYAHTLSQENIYTPELVVDGAHDVIGSRSGEVQSAIEAARKKEKPITVAITLSSDQRHLSVQFNGTPVSAAEPLDVWLVAFNPHSVTAIRGGENSGREMTSINNVTSIVRLNHDGEPLPKTLQVERSNDPSDSFAVLVQIRQTGAIIGATSYTAY